MKRSTQKLHVILECSIDMDSTKTRGEKTEAIVVAELVKRDIAVLTPFGENHRYDFAVEIDEQFYRLQCKTARNEGDKIVFSTKSTRPRGNGYSRASYDGDIDYFITHCRKDNRSYLIPIESAASGEMVLRIEPPKNNQSKGINWAEEYQLDTALDRIRGT
jgi:hypothetical protein